MRKKNLVLTHIVFWIVHTVFGFFAWDLSNYEPGFLFIFISIIVCAHASTFIFFYFQYFYLIPRFLLQKKYVEYLIILLISLILYILAKAYIWNGFKFIDGLFLPHQRGGVVFSCLFYYIISTALRMYDYWQESEQRKIHLQQEVNETELLYLKSQMSPHFLFNTLNNIYGLSLNNSSQTSLSISQLKDLMLYVEKFESGEKITLDQEIHYLKSFIALHQLRLTGKIDFETPADTATQIIGIEPMIFLPFIENAFKHGNINEDQPISINLEIISNKIHFNITNTINPSKRKDKVGGIGIKNIKRRLELLYPQTHELSIQEENNCFIVDLNVQIS